MEYKVCPRCKKSLPLSIFYRSKNGKYDCWCKNCRLEYGREWRYKNPEYHKNHNKMWRRINIKRARETHTKWRNNLRLKILNYISGGNPRCNFCGFSDIRILQIDHINGGGRQKIKRIGGNRSTIYNTILRMSPAKVKEEYQILCPNCNWMKKLESEKERGGIYAKI